MHQVIWSLGLTILLLINSATARAGDTSAPDTDGDKVADVVETQIGSDVLNQDSDSDGVGDGVAIWLGVDPLNGPPVTDATPTLVWPTNNQHLACEGHNSLGLLLS